MSEHIAPGTSVRTSTVDPPHHTRLPSYARGRVGTVIGTEGKHRLADLRAQNREAPPQEVYAVRFTAQELFGAGDHTVTLSLWEDYITDER